MYSPPVGFPFITEFNSFVQELATGAKGFPAFLQSQEALVKFNRVNVVAAGQHDGRFSGDLDTFLASLNISLRDCSLSACLLVFFTTYRMWVRYFENPLPVTAPKTIASFWKIFKRHEAELCSKLSLLSPGSPEALGNVLRQLKASDERSTTFLALMASEMLVSQHSLSFLANGQRGLLFTVDFILLLKHLQPDAYRPGWIRTLLTALEACPHDIMTPTIFRQLARIPAIQEDFLSAVSLNGAITLEAGEVADMLANIVARHPEEWSGSRCKTLCEAVVDLLLSPQSVRKLLQSGIEGCRPEANKALKGLFPYCVIPGAVKHVGAAAVRMRDEVTRLALSPLQDTLLLTALPTNLIERCVNSILCVNSAVESLLLEELRASLSAMPDLLPAYNEALSEFYKRNPGKYGNMSPGLFFEIVSMRSSALSSTMLGAWLEGRGAAAREGWDLNTFKELAEAVDRCFVTAPVLFAQGAPASQRDATAMCFLPIQRFFVGAVARQDQRQQRFFTRVAVAFGVAAHRYSAVAGAVALPLLLPRLSAAFLFSQFDSTVPTTAAEGVTLGPMRLPESPLSATLLSDWAALEEDPAVPGSLANNRRLPPLYQAACSAYANSFTQHQRADVPVLSEQLCFILGGVASNPGHLCLPLAAVAEHLLGAILACLRAEPWKNLGTLPRALNLLHDILTVDVGVRGRRHRLFNSEHLSGLLAVARQLDSHLDGLTSRMVDPLDPQRAASPRARVSVAELEELLKDGCMKLRQLERNACLLAAARQTERQGALLGGYESAELASEAQLKARLAEAMIDRVRARLDAALLRFRGMVAAMNLVDSRGGAMTAYLNEVGIPLAQRSTAVAAPEGSSLYSLLGRDIGLLPRDESCLVGISEFSLRALQHFSMDSPIFRSIFHRTYSCPVLGLRQKKAPAAIEACVRRAEGTLSYIFHLQNKRLSEVVLCLVAFNGHPARSFATLTRAFRCDKALWGCIKDLAGPRGRTALMASARTGDFERLRWLLERGADVNAAETPRKEKQGYQSHWGHEEEEYEEDGWEAEAAAEEEDDEVVVVLDEDDEVEVVVDEKVKAVVVPKERATVGCTSLMLACMGGHLETVRLLLSSGASVNAEGSFNDEQGITSLMLACRKGNLGIVRELLNEQDVDVNAPAHSKCRTNPLLEACTKGHLDIVRLLLSQGASLESSVESLEIACERGDLEVVCELLERKTISYADGATSLQAACRQGHLEIVRKLLGSGVSIVADAGKEYYSPTPLMEACCNGHLPVVRVLLERGVDVDAVHSGKTCLLLACQNGNSEMVSALISYGANVNAACPDGWTPLMAASRCNSLDSVRLLLGMGCSVNVARADGSTALMYACANWRLPLQVVRELLNHQASKAAVDQKGRTARSLIRTFHDPEGLKELLALMEP